MSIECATAGECRNLWDAMVSVMEVAVVWVLFAVVLTIIVSVVLYTYHGGDWPKEDPV